VDFTLRAASVDRRTLSGPALGFPMPLSLASLFRLALVGLMTGYAAVMYVLMRDLTGRQAMSADVVILTAMATLPLMVPLVWLVGLPELPEIYLTWWRASRRWRRGRCPTCDYITQSRQSVCPECGAALRPPEPYRFSRRTLGWFIGMAVLAWAAGCAAGEAWIARQPASRLAPTVVQMPYVPPEKPTMALPPDLPLVESERPVTPAAPERK
jgi:hypothetical protein